MEAILNALKDYLCRSIEGGGDSTAAVRSMHVQNVYQMVAYCENVSVCRRKLLVEHFGEVYDAAVCRNGPTPCDVCKLYKEVRCFLYSFYCNDGSVVYVRTMRKCKRFDFSSFKLLTGPAHIRF